MVYVGIDLHRRISHIAAFDEQGLELLSRRVSNDPQALRAVFTELGGADPSKGRISRRGARSCHRCAIRAEPRAPVQPRAKSLRARSGRPVAPRP